MKEKEFLLSIKITRHLKKWISWNAFLKEKLYFCDHSSQSHSNIEKAQCHLFYLSSPNTYVMIQLGSMVTKQISVHLFKGGIDKFVVFILAVLELFGTKGFQRK